MNHGWFTVGQQPGPAHTEQRKIMRKAMGPQVISKYDGMIYQEAEKLLKVLSGFSGDPRPLIIP
jgi:cytochrome P450